MKSVIISIICLLVIIIGWYVFYFYSIEDVTSYYWENLTMISLLISKNNWTLAEEKMFNYLEKWKNTRKLWIMLLNQHDIDQIDISIYRLNKFIKNKNIPLSLGEIEELKFKFKIINESECLTFENIF